MQSLEVKVKILLQFGYIDTPKFSIFERMEFLKLRYNCQNSFKILRRFWFIVYHNLSQLMGNVKFKKSKFSSYDKGHNFPGVNKVPKCACHSGGFEIYFQ